jgi:hypothetical protein
LLSLLLPTGVYADDDDDSGPWHVIVDNWQTHKPRVTVLRSLNAYLATDKGQAVYYVPTLEELPNIKNAVADTTDYRGNNQKFAAVYDGYFDQMCYEALVRKSDGTYSKTPAIVQSEGRDKVRELTTLGYDFLLTDETITDIAPSGEDVNAGYSVHKLDLANGRVDLNTALMDIYKAVGQEKYDITYIFTPDSGLTVTSSPIQGELSLNLSQYDSVDNSAGKAWVFVTRTNPSLYWKQAVYDGIVLDAEAFTGNPNADNSSAKSTIVTLADFCNYAYNIMNIYGEPVMTAGERSILLQLYGTVVPYSACPAEAKAIETFIAKGIISPEDDQQYLNWNSEIDPGYMLTLLMRIADINARTTYKDVQITLDASLIDEGYYQANLTLEPSSVIEFTQASGIARTTNYYDYQLSAKEFERLSKSFNTNNVSLELFIPTHLAIVGPDGTAFPITTQVTPYTKKVYSKDYPGVSYVQSSYDAGTDGPLMQFAVSDGMQDGYLKLRIAAFDIQDLLHGDGMYYFTLINDKGQLASDYFKVKPGGGTYYESGSRNDYYEDELLTDSDTSIEYGNADEIQQIIDLYKEDPEEAKKEADELISNYGPSWTTAEIEAILEAASGGTPLAAGDYVYLMQIRSGQEGSISVKSKSGDSKSLKDILAGTEVDGMFYVDPTNTNDLAFKKVSDLWYQVYNGETSGDLKERIRTTSGNLDTRVAFCKEEEELLVSTKYLIESDYIVREPTVVGEVLEFSTNYSNIYLDRENKRVVVGACVYDVRNLDSDEIWRKMEDGYFVNFRAVLGWTGDYLVFKTDEGNISVSVTSGDKYNPYTFPIRLNSILGDSSTGVRLPGTVGDSVYIQGNNAMRGYGNDNGVPMTSMYPFANYFVYMHPETADGRSDYIQDWLFVFKPKDVKVNGNKVEYDDSASRSKLSEVGLEVKNLSDDVTVWAYPLNHTEEDGMPYEMSWTKEYGYTYTPDSNITSSADFYANYFDTSAVLKGKDRPSCVLPYMLINNTVHCLNYNVYYTQDAGEDNKLDYGTTPISILLEDTSGFLSVLQKGLLAFKNIVIDTDEHEGITMFPAVTSPALWFVDRVERDLESIKRATSNGAKAYWGTSPITFKNINGETRLKIGSVDLTDKLGKQTYVVLRDTSKKHGQVGTWYSVSSLTQMGFDKNNSDIDSDEIITGPSAGELSSKTDIIDWDEFTASRLMETGEIAIAVAMVLVLNIMPRIALFLFLLLIMLGVIQNVKFWQMFCDRVFDVYKFLTFGRYDVHTFRQSRMFIHSIIAMAIFALFMDGTIIHVYELIMQFFAIITGMK